jgi:hypothetical protein
MREHTCTRKILVEKRDESKPLGQPTLRREDSIIMDFKNMVCGAVNWIHLSQDRVKRRGSFQYGKKIQDPYNEVRLYTRRGIVRFS